MCQDCDNPRGVGRRTNSQSRTATRNNHIHGKNHRLAIKKADKVFEAKPGDPVSQTIAALGRVLSHKQFQPGVALR